MKIPFDSLTLMAVARELSRTLTGGRIQRVTQPESLEITLAIRAGGANHSLVLSADASFARAHLSLVKRANPAEPPAFCMMCRKQLEGGVIRSVVQRDFDRILEVTVESAGRMVTLIAELMGKHSNLILVSESGMVLDAIKRITRKQSRVRELIPGVRYESPPPQAGKRSPFDTHDSELSDLDATVTDAEALEARILGKFAGMSPFLAAEMVLRARQASLKEAWGEVFGAAARGEWMPVLARDAAGRAIGAYPFATLQVDPSDQHERASINVALDHYSSAAMRTAAVDSARHELRMAIERALRAKRNKMESLLRSLQEAGRAEEYRHAGELLLANLHRVEPATDSVTVEDYSEGEARPREIPLDPAKSAQENAESYFRRYRKAREAARRHEELAEQEERSIRGLVDAARPLSTFTELDEIAALRRELTEAGLLRPETAGTSSEKRRESFQGKKIRTVTTPQGWEILVGENSEANEFLTTRVAGPNDLWLHVRATPSAHVVIRTRNEPYRVPQAVIKQAALLAARHSPSKHSATVAVDYTLKKYVRRPRGAAPGAVLYRNEKTIHVSPKSDG